ncbi:hypothetical protein ACJIZ3_002103 [Penstemon smallii]|uniref:GATA transcription factor n=1 Tax=Penstemon smallii TaxID=265156 RepID=A0ABD3U5V7_9LAMI
MLYRTHHQYHSSLSPHLLLVSSPPLLLPFQEMECVQGALETQTTAFPDDLCGVNSVGGDDLFVDELLDFSNGFSETEEEESEKKVQDNKHAFSVSTTKEKQILAAPENFALSAKHDFVPLPESEINVPAESLESLEWLSHFVEDSFSDYSLTGKLPPKPTENQSEPVVSPCFITPVQTKARTKRARSGVRVWPILSPSFTESSTSSSSSTLSTTSFSPSNLWQVQSQNKKQKKKKTDASAGGGGSAAASSQPRRCTHCGVTKTPQWRAGPLGSKTLCNACGVRYKSGRLLPEYRPACSPTYSNELHSNNHRKVLEMRRKREAEMEATQPVQSF